MALPKFDKLNEPFLNQMAAILDMIHSFQLEDSVSRWRGLLYISIHFDWKNTAS
jgi:hypothetical protein